MKRTANINTRAEVRTSDVATGAPAVTTYHFPTLGISVEAASWEEAFEKAKAQHREGLEDTNK